LPVTRCSLSAVAMVACLRLDKAAGNPLKQATQSKARNLQPRGDQLPHAIKTATTCLATKHAPTEILDIHQSHNAEQQGATHGSFEPNSDLGCKIESLLSMRRNPSQESEIHNVTLSLLSSKSSPFSISSATACAKPLRRQMSGIGGPPLRILLDRG
jgi:hypothetical protein